MYLEHFAFSEKPFSIAPNPRYLYMSDRHREALAHLLYGMQSEGGIVLLTGEVGTGKTTICRCMLSQIPDNTDTAFIINPKLSTTELLATICDDLGINYDKRTRSTKRLTDLINTHLLAAHAEGRHTVLIIDEAQNLEISVLEQLRLLTNLETDEKKLLQIILLGQPELGEMLAQKELRQLSQRITARYHLTPLSREESAAYMQHRLAIASTAESRQHSIFPPQVLRQLFKASSGTPRLINIIADRALLGAYAQNSSVVTPSILKQAIREVFGDMPGQRDKKSSPALSWAVVTLLILALALLLQNSWQYQQPVTARESVAYSLPSQMETAEIKAATPMQVEDIYIPSVDSRDAAFVPLFSAWGITYRPEEHGPACIFAPEHQLSCLRQQGDIASLRSLDRPAVLRVSDREGEEAFSAVIAISGTTATLAAGERVEEIKLARLTLQSHNDFTLLWRTPEAYSGPTRPGHRGATVRVLAEKSAEAQNQQWIGELPVFYDGTLKEQVKSFQRSQGLTPDGVAGPQTWIRMNSITGTAAANLRGAVAD